ncbi:alkaline phosphatase [Chryseobacterium nematophagum]|uniref:Alkaline phosphatase n=1 Tax=Chryseobacterium nematophagum TaxID=2305228 RepID=A0A3M7TJH0_9FLAO|nr:alkaline phosphatase D family protein [Chryseobacterium nematophagum]RNA63712.1 alkaline phosphatase [Chryseobacterium nematophagum]
MSKINRRRFLKSTMLAAGGIFLAPLLESCSDDMIEELVPAPPGLQAKNFDYGVASFDPTENSVIIWTRYESVGEITYEVASDIKFTNIIRQGKVSPNLSTDFTIAIDIQDLPSNKKWYYRFYNSTANETSAIGETITLPSKSDSVNEVKLAVASCANFPAGFFNVYKEIANSDVDVVIHLGDYIYEYAPGEYGTNQYTAAHNRTHKPNKELITLSDYRERYRQYRSDINLQLAHQKKPFICVWDDHEIANDAWQHGAGNHQPNEGSFEIRKTNALQAYSEYIPLKTGKDVKIYRSFDFGNILSLHMLDTRIIARDKQLDYANYFTPAGFNNNAFEADLTNPNRKMLGDEQIGWLQQKLNESTAKWQVLGQQVLMTKMLIPVEMLMLVNQIQTEVGMYGNALPQTIATLQTSLLQLVNIKIRIKLNDPTLTAAEIARVKSVLPYSLDAWDGYPMEREILFAHLHGKNVITLAGDSHNSWFGAMKDAQGGTVGKELATSSISSPGMENYLGANPSDTTQAVQLAGALQILVDDLEYANLYRRGYLYAKFNATNINAEWRYVDTVFSEIYSTYTEKNIVI